ncbi:hypothetical protein WR25_26097 [Diploscapter pachys]|uniref:Uncharacterized protein n=1 Tax=Diploscapter pachys TaxID=2018661 RepID=A0A2A2J5F9_9BILA|nr:hypothetical protein WR25_26097 [Diploscapter pachys]
MRSAKILVVGILLIGLTTAEVNKNPWTPGQYPDVRGPTVDQCLAVLPKNKNKLFICDPDRVLNNSQAMHLNQQLHTLATQTPCHCQRRSQCTTGLAGTDSEDFHGFIVSVAIVKNLQMQMHSPSEAQQTERAEFFTRTLEGRWALGDCGNSVIIFVWEHYKKMIIWPARLAEKYITVEERKNILGKVNELVQTDKWHEAISQVIEEVKKELNGMPQEKVDTGTLSFMASVLAAVFLTLFITCCVCAFRCCGNMKADRRPKHVQRTIERVDSLKAVVIDKPIAKIRKQSSQILPGGTNHDASDFRTSEMTSKLNTVEFEDLTMQTTSDQDKFELDLGHLKIDPSGSSFQDYLPGSPDSSGYLTTSSVMSNSESEQTDEIHEDDLNSTRIHLSADCFTTPVKKYRKRSLGKRSDKEFISSEGVSLGQSPPLLKKQCIKNEENTVIGPALTAPRAPARLQNLIEAKFDRHFPLKPIKLIDIFEDGEI